MPGVNRGAERLLGGFEHLVLRAIESLGEAYGVPIRRRILERTGRDVSVGALYTTLDRLERRGMISSFEASAAQKGGTTKRVFRLEGPGVRALAETTAALDAMGASERRIHGPKTATAAGS